MVEQAAADGSRKFKVTSDGLSATITLNAEWLQRPFIKGVVGPVVLKLNKRPDKETVSAEYLDRVEIDGAPLAGGVDPRTATAEEVVPTGAEVVALTFGRAPPPVLKFSVIAGGGGGHDPRPSFTITLDQKFMRKSFFDAVVVPYVTMSNKRRERSYGSGLDAQQLVEVHVDGQKVGGNLRTEVNKPAHVFLGHRPAHCELFFSWEAVKSKDLQPSQRLRFKVYIGSAGEMQQSKDFEWDHKELNTADGIELAKQMSDLGPFKSLKRIYLAHNVLCDAGVAALAKVLTSTNTPALKRLQLSHNRIGNPGVKALMQSWEPSPSLDLLTLDENWIGDEGAEAMLDAAIAGTLVCNEVHLCLNPGISPEMKGRLKSCNAAGSRGVLFNFNEPDTSQVWDDRGPWTEAPDGRRFQLSSQQFKL